MMEFLGMLAAQNTFKHSSRQQSEDEFYKAYMREAFPAITWTLSLLRAPKLWIFWKTPHNKQIIAHRMLQDNTVSQQASDAEIGKSELSQPNRPESITP
jgi:hypothetical protein